MPFFKLKYLFFKKIKFKLFVILMNIIKAFIRINSKKLLLLLLLENDKIINA